MLKKILGTILTSGMLSVGCGSGYDQITDFSGRIEGEHVTYLINQNGNNDLYVKRSDDKEIHYQDWKRDFIVDRVCISVDEVIRHRSTCYLDDKEGKPVIDKAQLQFEGYLDRILEYQESILEYRQERGLDLIE